MSRTHKIGVIGCISLAWFASGCHPAKPLEQRQTPPTQPKRVCISDFMSRSDIQSALDAAKAEAPRWNEVASISAREADLEPLVLKSALLAKSVTIRIGSDRTQDFLNSGLMTQWLIQRVQSDFEMDFLDLCQ